MWAIYKKEIRQFLNSLIAYIVIGVFLTGIGLLTWVFPETSVLTYGYADMETLFTLGPYVYMFLIPAITMRMLAEERKSGTIELLQTRPLSDAQIIIGKYIAAFTLIIFSILPTLIYAYSISKLGNPVGNLDVPGIAGSYLGLILLGGVFASMGILASALSENQIVSFIIAVFLCFFFYEGFESLSGLASGRTTLYIQEMGLAYHYDALSRGLIDTRNMVYFFSTAAIMLLLAHLKMVSRFLSFKPKRKQIWLRFSLSVIVIFVLNVVAANVYARIDLTSDKRYSLKPATKDLLAQLDQPLSIEILLSGDLPPQYQRLNTALIQTIKEFDSRSANVISYSNTDPSDAATEQERNQNFNQLMSQGLSPTRAFFTENGNQVSKLIFPYVILRYNGLAAAVTVFEGKTGFSPDEIINQSIENLEFSLAVGIQRMAQLGRKKVGLVRGHGELDSLQIAGFVGEMVQYFDLDYVDMPTEKIEGFDAIVIARPLGEFTREDKYAVDQYIMSGGKAVFLVDALDANLSQAAGQGTFGLPINNGLDDLLFRYGIRLEKNYLQDIQNFGRYPVILDGADGVINLPWPYFAGVNDFTDHPVTKNLDAVYLRTFGTIDTVKADGVKKTPLMFTSDFTKVIAAPARMAFEDYANQPDVAQFNHGREAVAYLLEGRFTSLFKNRILDVQKSDDFKQESVETKIVVVSDGDFGRNELNLRTGAPLELGFNPFADNGEKVRYANKDFLFNALAYLTDENGLITARAKEITLRPLNRVKVQEERVYWQALNLITPLLAILIFGVIRGVLRKRKYASFG